MRPFYLLAVNLKVIISIINFDKTNYGIGLKFDRDNFDDYKHMK